MGKSSKGKAKLKAKALNSKVLNSKAPQNDAAVALPPVKSNPAPKQVVEQVEQLERRGRLRVAPPTTTEIQVPKAAPISEVKPVQPLATNQGIVVEQKYNEKNEPIYCKIVWGDKTILQNHRAVNNPIIVEPGTIVEFETYQWLDREAAKITKVVGEYAPAKELSKHIEDLLDIQEVYFNDLVKLMSSGKTSKEVYDRLVGRSGNKLYMVKV